MQRPLRLCQPFLDLIRIDNLPLERKRTRLWRVANGFPGRPPKGGMRVDVLLEDAAGAPQHDEVVRAAILHNLR